MLEMFVIGVVLLFQSAGFSMNLEGLPCTEAIHQLKTKANMHVVAEGPVAGGIVYTLVDRSFFGKKKTALLGCGQEP